ncbi:MAG: hypothetical protein WCR84_00395 [Candidatus Paceibacterota bacterium]
MYKYKKKYKTKKKKSIFPYVFMSVLFFFIFLSLSYVFLFFPFFFVKKIEIKGYEDRERVYEIADNFVEKDFFSLKTRSIFLFDKDKLKNQILNDFFDIEKVEIRKDLLSLSIEINVKQREPLFVFCNNDCYLVDGYGIAFSYALESSPFAYFKTEIEDVSLGKKVMEEKLARFIFKLKDSLELEEVAILSPKRVNVKSKEGWAAYFNPQKDVKEQIENLNLVFEEHILGKEHLLQYIDLRFQDRVYYKYRE